MRRFAIESVQTVVESAQTVLTCLGSGLSIAQGVVDEVDKALDAAWWRAFEDED